MINSTVVEPAMYTVDVDWAPPYELITSLAAYSDWKENRLLDLGPGWVRSVASRLGVGLATDISRTSVVRATSLLVVLMPLVPDDRSVGSFLLWLSGLSTGDLYELLAARVDDMDLLRDLGGLQRDVLAMLTAWHEAYFRHVDGGILDGLASEAVRMRVLASGMPPAEAAELASNGVVYAPAPGLERITLVPQYHYRPWNVMTTYRGALIVAYPADVLPAARGEPSHELLRITRALSDDSRLRILHFLAAGTRTFTDVVKHTGLAKSTVNHHMVALRAAGLVRVFSLGGKSTSYTLRPGVADTVGRTLREYLGE